MQVTLVCGILSLLEWQTCSHPITSGSSPSLCRPFDLVLVPDTSLFHEDLSVSSSRGPLPSHHLLSSTFTGYDRSKTWRNMNHSPLLPTSNLSQRTRCFFAYEFNYISVYTIFCIGKRCSTCFIYYHLHTFEAMMSLNNSSWLVQLTTFSPWYYFLDRYSIFPISLLCPCLQWYCHHQHTHTHTHTL